LRIRHLPIVIAAVIGLTAHASATREYYLVGLRHIYMFDVWPDTHKLDRQAIEEDFSAAVATAQVQYDTDMASIRTEETQDNGNIHQVDRDAVQQNIEQAIADAADTRDASLGQLYVQCDYIRASHPEFQVDQDGPYQVMGCDTSPEGDFIDVCYYRPYPLYLDPCPFDWTWGHPYPFAMFSLQLRLSHSTWLSIGSPVFSPMYHAGVKLTLMAPVRLNVITSRASWAGGRPPGITDDDRKQVAANRELQRKAGIRPPSTHPGRIRVRSVSPVGAVSKYSRKPATGPTTGPPPSRYSHSGTHAGSGSGSGGSRGRSGGPGGNRGKSDGDKGGGQKKKGG